MIFFEKFLVKRPWLWNIFKCFMSFSIFHEKICSCWKCSNHKGEKDKETHNTLNTWHDYAYKLPCLIKLFHFQNQVEPSTKINEGQQRVSCWGHFTQCTQAVNKNQNNHYYFNFIYINERIFSFYVNDEFNETKYGCKTHHYI